MASKNTTLGKNKGLGSNKGWGADLAAVASPGKEDAPQPRVRSLSDDAPSALPGRGAGILSARTNRLAELASGAVQTRTHELIDPKRARMWLSHNRDYDLLNEERCADLIESFIAQGRQEVPAIVRRVQGAHGYDFEVICGARRHWTVSWLRENNYPDFKFLVEVRDLSDEEAFRLADLENRSRQDLSDYERAKDYLKALDAYYGGKQKVMAQRLNVSESWLSRYLDLARLPKEIVDAFASPHDLKIKHITKIKPLIKKEEDSVRVIITALNLARQQRQLREKGEGLAAAEVIRHLSRCLGSDDLREKKNEQDSARRKSERNMVFRLEDLKPGSVFVGETGEVLIDYIRQEEGYATLRVRGGYEEIREKLAAILLGL